MTAQTPTTPLLDLEDYVEQFDHSVVPAYRRGVADQELPPDAGLARSIIPSGTAASRDFSHLAPRIPEFIAERCVGCMACVSACPDSAILGVVVPAAELDDRLFFASLALHDVPPEITARSSTVSVSSTNSSSVRRSSPRITITVPARMPSDWTSSPTRRRPEIVSCLPCGSRRTCIVGG